MSKCSFTKLCDECAKTDTLIEPDSCYKETQGLFKVKTDRKLYSWVCDNHYISWNLIGLDENHPLVKNSHNMSICLGDTCIKKKVLIRDSVAELEDNYDNIITQYTVQHCKNCRRCSLDKKALQGIKERGKE